MSRLEEAMDVVKSQVRFYIKGHNLPPFIQPDDLLQEALVRMLRHIPNYDPSKGELKTFLYMHTVGAIQDFLRTTEGYSRRRGQTVLLSLTVQEDDGAKADRVADIPDPRANPEADCLTTKELPEFLRIAGQSLPQKDWLVLLLYYWEEKSLKEIGELLGVNESRASQLHDKALNRLSAVLYSMGIVRVSQLIG